MEHTGSDVHQKYSQVCVMEGVEVVMQLELATTQSTLRHFFGGRARARIVLECGGS